LILAAVNGHLAVVKALLEAGAEIDNVPVGGQFYTTARSGREGTHSSGEGASKGKRGRGG